LSDLSGRPSAIFEVSGLGCKASFFAVNFLLPADESTGFLPFFAIFIFEMSVLGFKATLCCFDDTAGRLLLILTSLVLEISALGFFARSGFLKTVGVVLPGVVFAGPGAPFDLAIIFL